MESEMYSIGRLARESGLGVSALRFYDGAGVFGPARVDPQTGYRWYAPDQLADARLLCRLRRVGLPLADIRLVLTAPAGSDAARRVLDAHLRRLEDGLADARRELSTVRDLLDQREHPMTVPPAIRLTVDRTELAAALAAVRFAVSTAPELPMLGGVLFDLDGDALRLVGTDRYRIAVARATVHAGAGGALSVLVPTALADQIRALAEAVGGDELTLTLSGDRLSAEADGRTVEGRRLELDFPDYRRLIRLDPAHRVPVAAAELRRAVLAGPTRHQQPTPDGAEVPLTVLVLNGDGSLRVAADPGTDHSTPTEAEPLRLAVNQEYLLQALAAPAQEQLLLELGGPVSPLAIRPASGEGPFSLLMPVRCGHTAVGGRTS
ncbi:MerR family transcriptional regulator [Kitasatospora sp. NPDC052896]|uniref:DNA polymerase III subunit beta family protein n=1 Tax=Kitasatospora sp. NPDC052896 TaxID=3364061 RepID=UPI0037CC6642